MITTTATDLPRLMHCNGSYQMAQSLPPDTDMGARHEGNAAHWLANERHAGRSVDVGARAYNGFIITAEMSDFVDDYLIAIGPGGAMETETSFEGAGWAVKARADWVWQGSEMHDGQQVAVLKIADLKYGHRLVSPVENWTLLAHAIGTVLRDGEIPDRVDLSIYQPRAYHPDGPMRTWSLTYPELVERYNQINATLSDLSGGLRTNLDICHRCPSLATCPAARSAGMNAIDVAQSLVYDDALPAAALAYQYEQLQDAEGWIKTLKTAREELIAYRIETGDVVPGYGVKPRYGHSTWIKGGSGRLLSAMTGVDLMDDKCVTPAEAKRRGVPEDVVAALTTRPLIGKKLERIDADAEIRRVFG